MPSDSVPPELIVDILSKASVKSLCRFRCVSKSWRTLITHPQFAKIHFSQSQHQKLLLIGEVLSSIDLQATFDGKLVLDKFDYPLEVKPVDEWISVYNSFNGLFFLNPSCGVYVLYNPSTRESKTIPDSQPIFCQEILSGFGYVDSIDDYKFVKIIEETEVHVFSLRNNSWKIVNVDFPVAFLGHKFPSIIGIPLHGAIHWVINDYEHAIVIAAFDLVEEKFRLLSLPDFITINPSWIRLRVLGDCLCIFYKENEVRTAFWIMKEYGVKESWIRIQISEISPYNPCATLCLWKNKGTIIVASDNRNMRWAICYQEDEKPCKDLGIQGCRLNGVHVYTENLVSLHHDNSNNNFTAQGMDNFLLNYLPPV